MLFSISFLLVFWLKITVLAAAAQTPESFKIWSILCYLIGDTDPKLLTSLFPIVTQLEESSLNENNGDLNLVDYISYVLEMDFDRAELSSLLPIFAKYYPLGLSISQHNISSKTYFELNGQKYNNPDDVFYLKSSDLKKQKQLDDLDDAFYKYPIIGEKLEAPIVKLYGCPIDNSNFEDFNRNLYSEASTTGKFRYIWIPTCIPEGNFSPDTFFMSATPIKVTDKKFSRLEWNNEEINIPDDLKEASYTVFNPTPEDLKDLDIKVASLITDRFQKRKNIKDIIMYTKELVNNFILLGERLLKLNINEKILAANEEWKSLGVDYNLLGLYINGQNIKLTSLNEYTLLNGIVAEYKRMIFLKNSLLNYGKNLKDDLVKKLLNNFSQLSLSNIQESQPIKIDLHKIPGFSESIIYFNDIEIDAQYNELSSDIGVFFDKTKYGEIPELRQNWNEVVFAINFNRLEDDITKEALLGMLRAIEVTLQGYPQRIGLLPICDDEKILSKIYKLKNRNLENLTKFLEGLLEGKKPKSLTTDIDIPNVKAITEDLQIRDNYIIVNGEIYPFLANTWRYLITRVTKKDIDAIRRGLKKYHNMNDKNINVRGILHLASTDTRHFKYTPDYFVDADYTPINNFALSSITDRVLEYINNDNYNTLHTISLVGDIDEEDFIRNINNALSIGFDGVRIRIIHTGSISSRNWKLLKSSKKSDLVNILTDLKGATNKSKTKDELQRNIFKDWLLEINADRLLSSSFITLNGRFIHLNKNEIISSIQFKSLVMREARRTLDCIKALDTIIPDYSEQRVDADFIESITSILSKLFYQGTDYFHNGIEFTAETQLSRVDFSGLLSKKIITNLNDKSKSDELIDLLLVLDPLEERTQKILSLVNEISSLPFVNIQLLILPTKELTINPINRFYGNNMKSIVNEKQSFFDIEYDIPSMVILNEENNKFEGLEIIVHTFNFEEPIISSNVDGLSGICLELVDSDGNVESQTTTMSTFGYGRFEVHNLLNNYTIRSCDPRYEVDSFSMDCRSDYIPQTHISIASFSPKKVFVKLKETGEEVISNGNTNNNYLNIYTVLKTEEDEELYKEMVIKLMSSLKEDQRLRFWVIKDKFSNNMETFRKTLDVIDKDHSQIELNFIKFNWPYWLRPQRFKNRRLDVSKMIFNDILFKPDVNHVVYMDPQQEPFDPFQLYESEKMKKGPFVITRMRGKGYWNEGYWDKMLKEKKLRFHNIHPGFLINLNTLRETHGSDKLRVHYQRLSGDVVSLNNIDQDLINDIQSEVGISPLRRTLLAPMALDDTKYSHLKSKFESSAKSLNIQETTLETLNPYPDDLLDDDLEDNGSEDNGFFEQDEL
ncbi:hypothetical protein TBLA_0A04570 [Henningerozyma blattae CBS 6284]|uniref:Uncharacterized protein n=1 Tax=Henningerozyma blattae (strain ATCC 34711 / CBS 6284 / DSM 70876 / NBRC 10599 / NRRL Y-10934 / UCD 77-7) TaxID=1071380 RepID=I2GVU9_HENB6|nr:hypothetical protein TBLA_0A04570 [Tetrapisispora blattae CBS 6284]CCH58251.1 hypothetical protein TBLA_0A04570 [Tetrapisispora blattae CBS 6284]